VATFALPLCLPQPAKDPSHAEKNQGQREVQLDGSFHPVSSVHQRDLENTSAVDCTQTNLHQPCGNRDSPAIGKMIRCHISPQLKRQGDRRMVLPLLFLALF
jgi:hypothetical protein